jgi:hypothetical protein
MVHYRVSCVALLGRTTRSIAARWFVLSITKRGRLYRFVSLEHVTSYGVAEHDPKIR